MGKRSNEMPKIFEDQNTTLPKKSNDFQKTRTQQHRRGSCSPNRGRNSNSSRVINRGNFKGHFRGNTRGFGGPRPKYQQLQWQNQNQSSSTRRQQLYQNFPTEFQILSFQPQPSSFEPQIRNFSNQNSENQKSQPQNSNFQSRPSFELFAPDPNNMLYTQQTQIISHKCYPNQLATNCTVRKISPRRGEKNPLNQI